jgi:hypothetical protein
VERRRHSQGDAVSTAARLTRAAIAIAMLPALLVLLVMAAAEILLASGG